MLLTSGIGATAAALMSDPVSVVAGTLSFYLVATGWTTLRRRAETTGPLDFAAMVFTFAEAAGRMKLARQALAAHDGLSNTIPTGVVTALGAVCDSQLIRRAGISGTPRIVRHLRWMYVAVLIAAVSQFLGQQQVFPAALRGSFLMFMPELLVLGALVFWLICLRKRTPTPTWA